MIKKIPMRLCLGCNEMKPKKELIRVVRPPDGGDIFIDDTGKKSGRGAYICRDVNCFRKARKTKRLERTFKCPIPDEVYDKCESMLTDE